MARHKFLKKRTFIFPDLKFNSYLIKLLINNILKNGKKTLAEYIVYESFKQIYRKTKKNPLKIWIYKLIII